MIIFKGLDIGIVKVRNLILNKVMEKYQKDRERKLKNGVPAGILSINVNSPSKASFKIESDQK